MNVRQSMRLLGMAVALAASGAAGAANAARPLVTTSGMTTSKDSAYERFRAAGKEADLTVLPTRMAGTAIPKVGEVVAMLLEKGGMTKVETSTVVFTPPEGRELEKIAKAFAEHIKANPPATEYVLFTEFVISREQGVSEVSGIVVNRQGEIVWQDRQKKGDKDFDRIKPREPMQCCLLVAERLRPVLNLDDPNNSHAATGKIAERWRKDTGVPDKSEMERIEKRGKELKKHAATATMTVHPPHARDGFSIESAANISSLINKMKLTQSVPTDKGPKLEVELNINEQKMLWSMAHEFSQYVKKNPPNSDYVLFADYLMPKNGVVGVHIAICDRNGDLVVVDFQNNHSADFNAIKPVTREDCDRLVTKRLETYCK